MLTLLALLSSIGSAPDLPAASGPDPAGPPVRLWMNNDRRFRPGDRVRLQVDADVDGFLLVLNYDADGRVRILFPVDPRDDASVQAGRRYEVRGANGTEAFRASGDGTGLIYTAVSAEPWRFEPITLADRWDYTRLEIDRRSTNPEEDLTNLVQSIAGSRGFDYDVLGYRVYGETTYYNTEVYPRGPNYIYDDYLYCSNWSWRYNGCRRYPFDGGWSFGFGYYGGYYGYDPFRYGSYGSYGSYGYRPFGYGGYYPVFPYRPGTYQRGPVIVGRSRAYTVQPRQPVGGSFSGGSFGGGAGRGPVRDVAPPINWRARGPARPSGGNVGRGPDAISSGSGRNIPEAAPPARRSRPDGANTYPVARGRDDGPSNDRGRPEPRSYAPRSRDDGGRSAPPPERVSGPSSRGGGAPPAPRAEPSRSSGGGHSSPPPSRPRRP